MAQHAFEPGSQFPRTFIGIVDAAHHRVLEGDPPVRGGDVVPAGFQEHFHAPAAIDGHDPVTDVVVRRVQRHGQRELGPQFHELIDLRHDAAGGHRDVPGTDVGAVLPGDDVEEAEHVVIVQKGLSHAHEDDVGDPDAQFSLGGVDLRQHLGGPEAPGTAVDGGRAEGTAHVAADLGGNTDGVTVLVFHQDRFHGVPVVQFVKILDGAVDGGRPFQHGLRVKDLVPLFQRGAELFRQVRHVGERRGVFLVQPGIDLPGPKLRKTESDDVLRQFFQCHRPDIVAFRHCSPAFSKTALKKPSQW